MHWVILTACAIFFFAILFGAIMWERARRETRAPFPENTRLLRGPGETLRRRLGRLDEGLFVGLVATLLLALGLGCGLALIAVYVEGPAQLPLLLAALGGLLAGLYLAIRRLFQKITLWRNTWIGFVGERIVAESLEPLKASGYLVFHDVPAGDPGASFNIDHVIVGPAGLLAVETKTRRKGRARDGFAANQIIYDGNVLAYPWGEDRHGLDKALQQAAWLERWSAQLLGAPVPVRAVLTFPGWTILRRGEGAVDVLAPREIAALALSLDDRAEALDERRINLIARQLETRCRDVEP